MERMQPTAYKIGEGERKFLPKDMQEIIGAYQEENKNLKEEVKKWKMVADENGTHYDMLEEENRKLKSDLEQFSEAYKRYRDFEKEELAESCYDLSRENDKLKLHIEAKDKAYMDLLTDYNYLKARIKKMEKAYLNFHDDLKKLDDKLDNDIMNR